MTEEADGLLLTDGRNRIFFHPPLPYPDGHGFKQQVDLVAGPFQGTISASSYERLRALRPFHQQLVSLHQSLSGEARLPDSYDTIKVSLKGDGRGHVTVRVDAIAGPCMDVRLSFGFGIDQTHLPPIIATIERFIRTASPRTQMNK
jgi:hypothetical protein